MGSNRGIKPESGEAEQVIRQIRDALVSMRDEGDRPGFYEEASDALAALTHLAAVNQALNHENANLNSENRNLFEKWSVGADSGAVTRPQPEGAIAAPEVKQPPLTGSVGVR